MVRAENGSRWSLPSGLDGKRQQSDTRRKADAADGPRDAQAMNVTCPIESELRPSVHYFASPGYHFGMGMPLTLTGLGRNRIIIMNKRFPLLPVAVLSAPSGGRAAVHH